MKPWKYLFTVLLLVLALLVISIFSLSDEKFHLIACDVGQGDAGLIIYKNMQILVDGGPDPKVLNCLGKYLPFWDREIEMVILTHPDSDHFAGLTEVFKRYKIDNYLCNPITTGKPEYGVLEKLVGREGVRVLNPHEGQSLRVGLIHLDILNPSGVAEADGAESNPEKLVTDESTNSFSVVSLISFGKFRALLTGDMPPDISDALADKWPSGPVNYIKISHHGSKNGTTENLLKRIVPNLAVISVGKNNYGHPDDGMIQMLTRNNIKILRTDKMGDIEVVTDGEKYEVKNEQKN